MTALIFAPPPPVLLPIAGGGQFPVRRVFCVGRNYADHVREMGHAPETTPPVFFTKPADALVSGGADTPYPPATTDYHHEMELVAAIGQGGADIGRENALDQVWGYAAGLDMTRRDLQAAAKKAGAPWDMAKGFDHSAVIGPLVPAARIGHPGRGAITLRVNGALRQNADISEMIYALPDAIYWLSRLVTLAPGDLIYTGTPAGVAACQRGDVLEGEVAGVGTVRTRII